MWQQAQVDLALDFIVKNNMNAMIFHKNDLVDDLVFPEAYYDNDIMWERWPVRRQGILYQRDYINGIIKKAKKNNIDFYLEIKEIYTIESIFELKPELRNSDGSVCPNNPFWFEFMREKFEELFEIYSDISGIIVSLGTRESPVSIAANRCTCERCKSESDVNWYIKVLQAMYEPISKFGKELIVRDFAYDSNQQLMMIEACESVSEEIIIALKAQPHDYYPTFPTNPSIGNTGKLRELVEFDTWGQYFGMGVAPMSLVEDIKDRLETCWERRVMGVWFRTDWELVHDASVHCSPSLVNLYAGAILSNDLDHDIDNIYKKWVNQGLFNPMLNASHYQSPEIPKNLDAYKALRDFMKASWKAFTKTGYILGHQFQESDQPPFTIEKAFEIMTVIHSREDWEPGASKRVLINQNNMEVIFNEKLEGISETKALHDILNLEELGVSKKFRDDMTFIIDCMIKFAELSEIMTRAMYLTMHSMQNNSSNVKTEAIATVKELYDFAARVDELFEERTDYPYYLYSRIHPERTRRFAENVNMHLKTY
jgi:hypothetical protein